MTNATVSKPLVQTSLAMVLIAVPVISVILSFTMLFVVLDNKDQKLKAIGIKIKSHSRKL